MEQLQLSRRRLLQSSGIVALGGLAGCLEGSGPGGSGDDSAASALDMVPEGVTAVARIDANALLNADEFRETVDELASAAGPGGEQFTVQRALDQVQQQTGLDPRKMDSVLAFGRVGETPYAGGYLRSAWTDGQLTDKMADAGAQTRSYGDETIHALEGVSAVDLGEGTYLVGTPAVVEDGIDLRNGDGTAVAGEVETAYAAARSGHVRVGFDVPDWMAESDSAAGQVASDIAYGYHSVYSVDGGLATAITFEGVDKEAASDLADQIDAALVLAEKRTDSFANRPDLQERAQRIIDQTEVAREGTTVTISNTEAGGELVATVLAAVVGSFVLGLGQRQTQPAPQVAFEFDYDTADEALTITHHGGDHVAASQLSIRGDGLANTGFWAELGGSASGDIGGQPAVVAGDSLTLQAQSDYLAQVIWESTEGSQSAMLAEAQGPDA